jgi:hypothetical protein
MIDTERPGMAAAGFYLVVVGIVLSMIPPVLDAWWSD